MIPLTRLFARMHITEKAPNRTPPTPPKVMHERQKSRIEETLRASRVLSQGQRLEDFLQKNKLAGRDESVFNVFTRATQFLARAGARFYDREQETRLQQRFMDHVSRFELVLGSPILTNAGRKETKSISACSIPSLKLSQVSKEEIRKVVGSYHTRGMGTGFSLDDLVNPVEMVLYLNEIAISEVQTGQIERSVGNMGVLSIKHPHVLEFIRIKRDNPAIKEWKFNLSVNFTDDFIYALKHKTPFTLSNGDNINPEELMKHIAECAHATGDPGIIFMDRMNAHNRLPHVGSLKTAVPCGEVSLFDGEVCQFSYINVSLFIKNETVDKERLRQAVHTAVIMLDNAIEANSERMPCAESAHIISSIRRIGIGICGFAEALHALGLPYGSCEAREFACDLMSFINYESKCASIQLAKKRGPFTAFDNPQTRKELFLSPFQQFPTKFVTKEDWERLGKQFELYKIRNVATTILPPTGRSSLIAGVTASIEPPFRLAAGPHFIETLQKQCRRHAYQGDLGKIVEHVTSFGSIADTDLPQNVKDIFKTALEISPDEHLAMTSMFQRHTDEGISKTVNLPQNATPSDVTKTFLAAYELNLKGVTIYRDQSRTLQPKSMNTTVQEKQIFVDPIYGPISVSERVSRILTSKPLERLKHIHQNGTNYLVDPRQTTSRYEHSFGAYALAGLLGADEAAQVSSLLHDISHTAFSHVIDLVFENPEQNYHDQIRARFLQSMQETIRDLGITTKELEMHPIVKGEGLNVDRLDYAVRDLLAVSQICQPEYSSIINNLVINEEGQIVCTNFDTARLIFRKFIEVNLKVYFDPKAEVAAVAVATILQKMLLLGLVTEEDFLTTDDIVIEKILESPFKEAFMKVGPDMEFYQTDTPSKYCPVLRKLRFINPKITGLPGVLTDHCTQSKDELDRYLQTPKTLYYDIPLLRELP